MESGQNTDMSVGILAAVCGDAETVIRICIVRAMETA